MSTYRGIVHVDTKRQRGLLLAGGAQLALQVRRGLVGALLGGFIATQLGFGGLGGFFNLWTWVVAIGGSVILLVIYRLVRR